MSSTTFCRASIWSGLFVFAAIVFDATHITRGQEPSFASNDLNFFETKIRPVLVDKCYGCHSDQAKNLGGGLRVDSRDGLIQGGDSGAAIEPGNPDDSLLMLALSHEDDDYAMPPNSDGGKLPDEVIADFRKWIKQGAADPRKISEVGPDPGAGDEAKNWWAYQPRQNSIPPTNQDHFWSTSPIDQFVFAALEAKGLKPVADASPTALLRRVYFDLTGLPPSVEDAKAFSANWEKAANDQERLKLYESVVDRLLASPQYGEHWGRHWLDVARFAESSGKDLNTLYPLAWQYRDYVIDAFNQDKPYDQFIREQIAGDLLRTSDKQEQARNRVATGFLAIGAKSINEQNPRQLAVDIADEQIDTVSQAFLGVTIACARCHDHKFDPISQVDYTALSGIFLSTQTHYGTAGGVGGRNAGTLLDLPASPFEFANRSLSKQDVQQRREQLAELEKKRQELVVERIKNRNKNDSEQGINELLRASNQIAGLKTVLSGYDDEGNRIAQAMGVSDKPASATQLASRRRGSDRGGFAGRRGGGFVSIADSPLFVRGEIDRPSDKVPRGIPGLFSNLKVPKVSTGESGRRELSNWIAEPQNPLTSRVMVNRIWHWLMGAGLVTSTDNFGTTGAIPSHPELLDHLANRFVDEGWSVKALVREVVMSHAYRLSTDFDEANFKADPANTLLWRHHPKRLEAESIRDSILAASGQLSLTRPHSSDVGRAGNGVLGRQRFGTSEDNILHASGNFRSIYLPLPRDVEPEILGIFDYPDASAVQGVRQSTNVPGQALYMMNSDFVETQCKRIAQRLYGRNTPTSNRLRDRTQNRQPNREKQPSFEESFDELCWTIFSRPASTKESSAAKKLFQSHRDDPVTGAVSVIRAMLASAEFRSID